MKKALLIIVALLSTVGTVSAAWKPNEQYATFCDNFKFDHVFAFYSAGGPYNGTQSMGVGFERCQGAIAFSLMTWDRRVLAGATNYGMKNVAVYLTADGQNDMFIADISFTDPKTSGNEQDAYNNQSNFSGVNNKHGCTTYFLQKRQYTDHDRCQFSYFNIVYSQEVYNYIHNHRSTLGLKLKVNWCGDTKEYTYRFQDGEKNDIVAPVEQPTLSDFQWTKNSEGKTVLRFTASDVYSSVYYEKVKGDAASGVETGFTSQGVLLDRERTDVASLTRNELNLFGQDVPPYYIEVARCPRTVIPTDYYNSTHGGPASPFIGPRSESKIYYVPALYLPENVELSHTGGDSIYARFEIPKKSVGRIEDESAIIIEYSTDENFGSYETERVDYNTYNRWVRTSYNVGLPIPHRWINKGRQTIYVRLSREFVDHTTTCVKKQILINTDARKLSSVGAQDIGGQIEVSWTHVGDYKGIWTSDMFYRVEYVVSGTTYSQTYNNRDLRSVKLTEGIATCLPIEYTVQVCTAMRTISSMTSAAVAMATTREAIISSLTATKGDSNNRVRLQWTVPRDKNEFSYFTITRALRGDSVATTLVPQMMMNKALTTFTYEDNSLELGTYYTYTVTGYRECNDTITPMSSLSETGFALPYGVITGQITYDGRQGVPGVLVTATTDDEVLYPQKVYFDTVQHAQKATYFRTLKPTQQNGINGPQYTGRTGTAMFWIRNLASNRTNRSYILWLPKTLLVYMAEDGSVRVRDDYWQQVISSPLTQNEWYHVAVCYTADTMRLYLNGQEVAHHKYGRSWYLQQFTFGDNDLNCELADFRLYNYCMDSTEVKTTAVQIPLKGNETGLEIYYSACEEGDEVHDLSGHSRDLPNTGLSFNKIINTDSIPAKVNVRVETDSTRANYTAYTKSDGTYVITGIPYREAGTYYKIVPTLGTHEFAPANRPLYFNNNTNTHNNINFTDQTSVKVSGAIYYEGTDYPVEGVSLSVDGVPCITGGVPAMTNADGQFSILVPMGKHYITATKKGHTFAYNGRYPEDPNNVGTTYEFLHDITDLTFYDNTKLLLVGRVAGGDEELHKPHGMHMGKANIGRAVITLQASEIYSLNTDSVERVWAQPTDSIVPAGRVVTSPSGTDLSHNVVIYTDSVTGEYTALLPPLTYKVKSIVIPSNDEYRFNPLSYNPIELGARAGQPMWEDSLRIDSTIVQRVKYHLAFDAPYYTEPVLTVTDAMRSDLAFGEEWVTWEDEKDRVHMIPSFTVDSVTGEPDYRMNYPLFRQGSSYRWRLKVTENYVNKDTPLNPVTTVLPWKNGIVTIQNEIGNRIAAEKDTIVPVDGDSSSMVHYNKGETIALSENQIALDSTGMGIYQFRASDPNLTSPYTLGADITFKNVYGTRQYAWQKNGHFYGIVLGSITNGSDILTSGPDDVLYILRNAPGSGSTVSATAGTTFTKSHNRKLTANWGASAKFKFAVGSQDTYGQSSPFGFFTLMKLEERFHLTLDASYTGNKSWSKSETYVNTLTQTVRTTPGSEGAGGDVFVGQATNDVFSNSRRVDIARDPSDSTRYYISDFDGFVMGRQFGTQFVYTQSHIEKKVLPDYLRMRNELLQTIDDATIARYQNGDSTAIINTTSKMQYYTALSPSDPRFGEDSTYIFVLPKIRPGDPLYAEKDMVHYYNEQVRTWKQLLAHNERMKVMCQQRTGDFNQEQYDQAVQKVVRLREVMNKLSEARDKMAAVSQYNIDSLEAFNQRTRYGDDQRYMGFSKGEVERLIKNYRDSKKEQQQQLDTLQSENLDTLRLNVSDYYSGGYLMRNISLSPGASVVLGATSSVANGDNVSLTNNGSVAFGGGFLQYTPVVKYTNSDDGKAGFGGTLTDENKNNESFSTNITLAMNGKSSMSFDVYAAPDGFAPIFFVRGGATACPYVGEERTKYYQPGQHILTTSTAAIDKPYLYLRQGSSSMQKDLPVGASAYFTIGMTNQSSVTGSAGMYKLRPIDRHTGEELGAVLEVNGTPLTSAGISYRLPTGDSTFVTLRVYQSNPEVMNYEDIGLELYSDCDPSRRSELHLSVSYRYSCSDINLTLDNTLLNTQTKAILGKDTVELSGEISGLRPDYSALYGVRLQYKRGEGEWGTMRTWRKGITVRDTEGNYPMPEAEHFRFSVPMPDKEYADGNYQVRAVTVCRPAAEEEVCKESETFTVIKDVVRPEPITIPTPADGVLRSDNEMSVTFNKDIQPARVLGTNISVTGELNGHDLRHAVGLLLSPQKAATQATLRLGASDFTLETWINYSEEGELMNIGGDKFRISIDAEGYLLLQIDSTILTSAGRLPKNKWAFMAMCYKRHTMGNTLQAWVSYDEVTDSLMRSETVPVVNTKAALQIGGGGARGVMHDLALWSTARDMTTSLSERNRTKLPSTPGLVAYWPMNEGYGKTAYERVHSRHITTGENAWWIAGENYSAMLEGNNALRIPISELGIGAEDDYAIDCWVKTTTDGAIFTLGDTLLSLTIENGKPVLHIGNNEKAIIHYTLSNDTWHYVALNVRQGGTTSVLMDEQVVLQFVANHTMPCMGGDYLTIGQGLTGAMDALRISRASLTNELLLLSSHFRLKGNETGLVAYYPFEKDSVDSGNQHLTVPTLEDRCTNSLNPHAAEWINTSNGQIVHNLGPALIAARSVEAVPFTFTASDRQIRIALDDEQIAPARVEGCNLSVEVKDVVDNNGNYATPVCWNILVQRNSLLWKDNYVSVTKHELDEKELTLSLINTGSEVQNWSITNIPTWLNLSATAGIIAPQSELTLTATVNASAATGYYTGILLLTGNDGIAEACIIEASVLATEPEWIVNESAYESTGNIIARLNLPAGVAQSEHDIIAAFTGEDCVGIAHPQYINAYDAWYVMMTVHGNANSKSNLRFRLWNAETGITYSSVRVLPAAFRFSPNMVKGTLAEPVVLEVTNRLQETLALQPAWNWISLNIKPISAKTENIFAPVLGDVSEVKSKTQFFTVNETDTTFGGSLKYIGVTSSYRVHARRQATLTVEGTAVNCAQTPITIRKGWNWIGYLPLQTMSVNDALADIEPMAGDLVKGKKAFAVYDGAQWIGTLTRMTPGEGYMYLSNAAGSFTFRYPESHGLMANGQRLMANAFRASVFEPVTDPYSGNMSIVARVMNGTEAVHGVEVGIFAGEECRGAATEDEAGDYWFITVAGDESTPLTIRVYDPVTETTTLVEQSLQYTDDANIGTLAEPYIIQLQTADGIEAIGADERDEDRPYKVLENNHVVIIRGGEKYDATGKQLNE